MTLGTLSSPASRLTGQIRNAIFHLNQNVLNSGQLGPSASDSGWCWWPTLDKNFTPPIGWLLEITASTSTVKSRAVPHLSRGHDRTSQL
jgi:hypothetical protein